LLYYVSHNHTGTYFRQMKTFWYEIIVALIWI
jgi:hypothetical protein